MGISERRACQVLRQHRSTQRKVPRGRADEDHLVADMIELARQYGRYGYRRIAALLRDAGWQVNDKRVERLRRRDGGGSENSPGDCFPDDAESADEATEKG